jgi:Tfp pilus assembly protein FimT
MELLIVVGLTGVIAAIAVPMMSNTLGDFRLRGDARSLTNATSLTKLRAASDFTQTRLYVDLGNRSFQVQTWHQTGTPGWVTEGGATYLSQNVTFGFGSVGSAPPNSQGTIGQAAACLNDTTTIDAGPAIANTACVLFNSRGIPVDTNKAPTPNHAVYITDNTAVYGITLSATGLINLWRTNPTATPTWVLQ